MSDSRPRRSAALSVSYCEDDEEQEEDEEQVEEEQEVEQVVMEEDVEGKQLVDSDDDEAAEGGAAADAADKPTAPKRSRLTKTSDSLVNVGSAGGGGALGKFGFGQGGDSKSQREKMLNVSLSTGGQDRHRRKAEKRKQDVEEEDDYKDNGEQDEDDEDDDDDESDSSSSRRRSKRASKSKRGAKKRQQAVGVRKSTRGGPAVEATTRMSLADVPSDSSDDEFAREHFILPSDDDDDDDGGGGEGSQNGSGSDDESRGENEEEIRVQHILARRCFIPEEWRKACDNMNTREITRGSFFVQPDEEYFDNSLVQVEKFLVKWAHASYLHVSWETEKDLVEEAGASGKTHLKKFREREAKGEELFEDLGRGDLYPPSFTQIDRILDVDDESIDIQTVDWKMAPLPSPEFLASATEAAALASGEEQEQEAELTSSAASHADGEQEQVLDQADEGKEEDPAATRRSGRKTTLPNDQKSSKAATKKASGGRKGTKANQQFPFLHGSECWVTVKWENMPYSDATLEKVGDLHKFGIDYEPAMRSFFRREQLAPAKKTTRVKRTLDVAVMDAVSPTLPMNRELRDYQWEGVRWMLFNWSQKRNSILADEMGLGKTIQSAVFLQMLRREQGMRGPFLIVAPLSTVVQWQREISLWTEMDAVIYHGSIEDREIIRAHEFSYLSRNPADGYKLEVVITTPETCMAADNAGSKAGQANYRMKRELSRIQWDFIVIDEAHKLKNFDSKVNCVLREEYHGLNYLLLTGTPLQNNTDELWTLLNFVDGAEFADRDAFKRDFGDLKTPAQLDKLQQRLRPYLLRREKEHVEKDMPSKEEVIIEVELTVPQKQYYRAIYEQKTGFLYKGGAKDGPSLSNLAMELRKCCNHPFLIKGAETELAKHFVGSSLEEVLVKSSGKMTLLDKLLPKLQADGHRVLIFSQFRIMLNIIEDYMVQKGFLFDRVDGAITGRKRQAAIDRYSAPDSKIFAMLLSTRAGGVGINLTSADTVIIFDSDWNPQNDVQAQARAHRIGQTKPVKVYRLLSTKTYEMAMFQAASIKLGLDYAVMNKMQGNSSVPTLAGISNEKADHFSVLSKKEQENLLKHGAYDVFNEERNARGLEDSKRFCEDDIDTILQRSARVVHDSKNSSGKPKLVSAGFSKASFVAGGTGNDIQIDDPDFWTKVVGLSEGHDFDKVEKKRKCRTEVVSYKEPTNMTFRVMENGDSDSSDSEGSVAAAGAKRSKNADEEAEWSDANLTKLVLAMISNGYGNWASIRRASKLRWSAVDISKACRYALLQVMFLASLADKPQDAIWSASLRPENVSPDKWGYEDLNFIAAHLEKNRACRLALAALEQEQSSASPVRESDGEPAIVVDASVPAEDALLRSVYDKSAMASSAFAFFDEVAKCKSTPTKSAPAPDPAPAAADSDDMVDTEVATAAPTAVDKFARLKQVLDRLRDSDMPSDFTSWKDARKSRLQARSKLNQIEDMFEMYLAAGIAHGGEFPIKPVEPASSLAAPAPPTAPNEQGEQAESALPIPMEQSDETPIVTSDAAVDALVAADSSSTPAQSAYSEAHRAARDFLAQKFASMGENLDPAEGADGWTLTLDAWLVLAINQVGWPEGKRRLAALEEQWHAQKDRDWVRLPLDFFAGKFPAKRAKEIATALRGGKSKAMLKAASNAEAIANAESKAVAAAALKAKKLRQAVVKAIEKVGRPRESYTPLAQMLGTAEAAAQADDVMVLDSTDFSPQDRLGLLLTFEALAKECELTSDGDLSVLKELVAAVVSIGNADPVDPSKAEVTEGPMAGMNYKALVSCCEKSDTMHHLRLSLAVLSSVELRDVIEQNCKAAGPSVVLARRDNDLPVWWTVDHDVHLLRLVASQGLGQWKKLIAEKPISDAPSGFEMPDRIQGK